MAIIKCKMCGGDIELSADKTMGMCEFCGSTMTFPKVDDEQRAAAFNRGNHFRRIGEFDKALAVYERIVREDDMDAEAHWCCALCRFGIEYVEDPATYEWLPTCHRASFDSFLEDVDYLAAVEHSDGITRRQYQKDAAKIAEVQRGILATSQNTEPYDVFICYKESDESGNRTRDSLLAQDIYYQLTEQGRKVFFSRITLEDMVGTQYEPYIFAALNSAKVMIAVGTKPEYMNAVWVKNEWSRFLAMMKKDRSKVLLPCYRDMDPYDLPEQLSVLQSYDMGKIGFIQDLTRGIAKVLDANKQPAAPKETVVVQQVANNNVVALLKRGSLALEDGEWEKADSFYEEVLNQDAECADAYMGKLLAELHIHKLEDLTKSAVAFEKNSNYQRAVRFAQGQQQVQIKGYVAQNLEYMLQKAQLALDEGRYQAAKQTYEEVLKLDQKNAQAHLGKVLAANCAPSMTQFVDNWFAYMQENCIPVPLTLAWVHEQEVSRYVVPGYLSEERIRQQFPKDLVYHSTVSYWNEQAEKVRQYIAEDPQLKLAVSCGDDAQKQAISDATQGLLATVEACVAEAQRADENSIAEATLQNEEMARQALEEVQKRQQRALEQCEQEYQELCGRQASVMDMWSMRSLAHSFYNLVGYKDCAERGKQCEEKFHELQRKSAEQQKKTEQRKVWIGRGLCSYCGGEFKGLFTKSCAKCGKPKDY